MNTVGNTPSIHWADRIYVHPRKGGFQVSGIRYRHPPPNANEGDLAADYARAISQGARLKGGAEDAPHLRFARADSDEKLQAFIQMYGPVAPAPSTVHWRPTDRRSEQTIVAFEDLSRLRQERCTFIAAIELLAQIRSKTPTFRRILELVALLLEGTTLWLLDWGEEDFYRETYQLYDQGSGWNWNPTSLSHFCDEHENFSHKAISLGVKFLGKKAQSPGLDEDYDIPPNADPKQIIEPCHAILCALLSGFPTHVRRWKGHSIEFPSADLTFGIRPALYYLLRCDYLSDVHIERCPQGDCEHKWFIQSRPNRIFCSDKCERKHRQREYYLRKGKETKKAYYDKEVKPKRAQRSKAH